VIEEPRVHVQTDRTALAATVAAAFVAKVTDLVAEFGEATIVLTGGTMGEAVLEAVRTAPGVARMPWDRINVWWGDERWLPAGDAERNETLARRALLDHVPVDPARIHPMPAADAGLDLDAAAAAYEAEIAAAAPSHLALPPFDILFLGVGPDGHVASLFPNASGIRERERLVIPVRNSPKPPAERLSLTLPVINSAVRAWMVLSGHDKASPLGLALAGASVDEVPVAGVRARRTTIFWVDQDAAAEVPSSLIEPGEFWTADDDQSDAS